MSRRSSSDESQSMVRLALPRALLAELLGALPCRIRQAQDPDPARQRPAASVFDRVVAIDAGVDELFSYGGVKPEQVAGLVHGAIFTRGPRT